MFRLPLPFPQKTTWFFLPWLLWLTCLVAIFFFGQRNEPLVWLVCAGYAVSLYFSHGTIDRERLANSSAFTVKEASLSALPYVLDLCFYGVILIFHGGASNAGVSILYLPVIVAAMEARRRIAWTITALAIAIYTGLMMQGHAAHFNHLSENFANHLSGMWLTFVISVLLITWFVTGQRQALVSQEKQIHRLRERQLRDEQILAVATIGANTTHRLATPLSTARLLVDELTDSQTYEPEIVDDLSAQIQVCHQAVHNIANQVRSHQTAQTQVQSVSDFIEQTIEYWWVSRNDIRYQVNIKDDCQALTMLTDFNLQMSLTNLLENAAYASIANNSDQIEINVSVENSQVGDVNQQQAYIVINIDDYGQGIAPSLLDKLGQKPLSNKPNGMGMGLALANATIERFHGHLQLFNLKRDKGVLGSRSQVKLPRYMSS